MSGGLVPLSLPSPLRACPLCGADWETDGKLGLGTRRECPSAPACPARRGHKQAWGASFAALVLDQGHPLRARLDALQRGDGVAAASAGTLAPRAAQAAAGGSQPGRRHSLASDVSSGGRPGGEGPAGEGGAGSSRDLSNYGLHLVNFQLSSHLSKTGARRHRSQKITTQRTSMIIVCDLEFPSNV